MAKYYSLKHLPKFESYNEALEENYIRISILQRVGGFENNVLADKLIRCSEQQEKCNSVACKVCNRDFRIKRVDELVSKIRRDKGQWHVVTIIDYNRAFSDSYLLDFEPRKAKDRMRKQICRSGFEGPMFGTLELDRHRSCGLWLPHFHLIYQATKHNERAVCVLRKHIQRLQRQHIKQESDARPFKVQKLKKPFKQTSYAFKLVSLEVVDYICSRSGKRRTTKQRLLDKMFCEHLCWIDRMGRRAFLFSLGERGW
ncbi:hypothetical protein [Photobacterium leiognathi]|uniref:hypothetical protein n=1 Tax=Photobacterium leiognathi TaxID=553611 RepID=UPI000769BC71|nr:hypothetical protein [Photobacterium leiognathi]